MYSIHMFKQLYSHFERCQWPILTTLHLFYSNWQRSNVWNYETYKVRPVRPPHKLLIIIQGQNGKTKKATLKILKLLSSHLTKQKEKLV